MVHDFEQQTDEEGLDLLFGVQPETDSWSEEHGGSTTYLDETTPLLTLLPYPNTLSLVYRDKGCMRFVKFLSSSAPSTRYDLQVTYIPDTDSNHDDDDEDEQDEDEQDEDEQDEDEQDEDEQDEDE
eukprot:TRINITY_DN5397_c0_g1_i2.p2 TRINITY_DN5397_c0_g1~~TRINITY_DN5397_c0_g1_i2.p2  ORF type:complete len:126 (-),score=35.26 TRINITY_DN5397_c0_g1_i2:284-661(-)